MQEIEWTQEQTQVIQRTARRTLLGRIRENWMFYVSISPFFILFFIFGAFPILFSLYLGFTEWDGLNEMKFIGVQNYIQLFKDPIFLKSIWNTLYIWLGSTVCTVTLAFILAFLVNHYVMRGQSFFRVVFLFPLLVAPALTAIILSVLFSTNVGLVNGLWSILAGKKIAFDWFGSVGTIKPMIILLVIWRWTGWHFIIFLSGLQTISSELYQAARVDGARGGQIFRYITFPMMTPMLLFSAVTATIGGIQIFDEPYVLTNGTGGTLQAGTTLGMYLYQTAFQEFHFGLASAMSYVIFGLILLFSLLNSRLLKNQT